MKKLLLLVPLIVFIISCAAEKGTNFYPLSVGNEWNYEATGTITTPDTSMTTEGTMDQEITSSTTLDNGTSVLEQVMTFNIDMPIRADTSYDTTYVEETSDYILSYDSKADTVADTMLALPLTDGKTWNVGDGMTAVVLGKETVTVPLGTYTDCWKLAWIMGTDTMYVYLGNNVGLVKGLFIETEDSVRYEMSFELESATIQ